MTTIDQKIEKQVYQELQSVKVGQTLTEGTKPEAKMVQANTSQVLFDFYDVKPKHKATTSNDTNELNGNKNNKDIANVSVNTVDNHSRVLAEAIKLNFEKTNLLKYNPVNSDVVVQQQKNLASVPLFTFAGAKTDKEVKDLRKMKDEDIANYPPSFDEEGRYKTMA